MPKLKQEAVVQGAEMIEGKAPAQKIKAAYLHQTITWPGLSGAEKTISAHRIPGLTISFHEHGLMLEKKNGHCLVPWANIANVVMEEA